MAMKKMIVLVSALSGAALPAQEAADGLRRSEQVSSANCAPLAAAMPSEEQQPPPLLVPGLGYAGLEPDSSDPDAVQWFKQGARLVWAFDEAEAIRAFQMAQRIDRNCALCFWGEAWARGPTINLRPRSSELEAAREAAGKAAALGGKLGSRDRLLVETMLVRTRDGKEFDHLGYAGRLEAAALRLPQDDLVNVLAADARMVAQRPGEFKPNSLTQRLLERVLQRTPDHGGAIHYYIHLTDWIDRSYLAVPHAERLGRIAPAASHLVHMPSHSFYGVGRYRDAAAVNVTAIAADRAYVNGVRPPSSNYRTGLLAHNMHFAINSALMRGDGETAASTAAHYRAVYGDRPEPGYRLLGSATFFAAGLHGELGNVLRLPEEKNVLGKALRHYARGEAHARRGDGDAVHAEAKALAAILASNQSVSLGSKTAEALVEVAQHVLEGRAAMLAGNPKAAAEAYFEGHKKQAAANFSFDPPLFWYPVRRSYAAALLAAGEPARAREHLYATLKRWPNDPLALYALAMADQKLGDSASSAGNLKRARAGWAGDLARVPLWRI